MATVQSTQVAKLVASAPRRLDPRDGGAKSYKIYFDYTVPAGTQLVADILQAIKLPKQARIVDYWFGFEALSSGGGTAGADVGITGDGQRFLTALNMDAAGEKRAAYVKTKMPDKTEIADDITFFILTVTGEAWAAAKVIEGWVEVVMPGG